ncbi:MAG TPA: NUDIX hydrolase [Candidatus Binatia bacterium]|nr:NUDIX hydrolase [Candidatus Binatia bacterium]
MSQIFDAATVILVRDGADGLETLMLRRNSKLDFAGGMWVFPGGRVDEGDRVGLAPEDDLAAARRAAVREALEETGLAIREESLLPFSHWTPPDVAPKRFLTWFFLANAPAGDVSIDFGEIHDQAWLRPADAMRRRNALEIELLPPTWVTLERLAGYRDVAAALADSATRSPERFATRVAMTANGGVTLWQGDAAYDTGDPDLPGPRHRLWMLSSGWRYERS